MRASQLLTGGRYNGMISKVSQWNSENRKARSKTLCFWRPGEVFNPNLSNYLRELRHRDVGYCIHTKKPGFHVFINRVSSESGADVSDVDEIYILDNGINLSSSNETDPELNEISKNSKPHGVKRELLLLSFPAVAGQAIEPIAQLMETAYIGRLGSVELASTAVSMSIFNIVSKLLNIPLLSVATSHVAEDISKNTLKHSGSGYMSNGKPFIEATQRRQLSSVSTALLLALGIGILEALALSFGSGMLLSMMGISSASPMRAPAELFLSLRALGAPALVASLTLQGIFRGFKDTKTPLFCLGMGNLIAALLFPILMYHFKLGITGAAISTVSSQYIITIMMLWFLNKKAVLLPPKIGALQFGSYMKSGGFVLGRTVAVVITMTLGTSMAARQGPLSMAAHQICMQVWLAVSLLTDSLAASAQALIASFLSKGDYMTVKEITNFVLMIGLFTGVVLGVVLGASFGRMVSLFTKDAGVLAIVKTGVLFVSASQPMNSLAFIYDGLHFGASDFLYAACSMMLVGAISSAFLLFVPPIFGLRGVWSGLALFMALRVAAGYLRLSSKTGPWWFMHNRDLATKMGN